MDTLIKRPEHSTEYKRIVCVWEMGGNLGHLANLKFFIDEALVRGHRVSLVARQLQHVSTLFHDQDIDLWQAPFLTLPFDEGIGPLVSYPEMILTQGFANSDQLHALVKAWDNIFSRLNPDLVVYDHAPSALIASVGQKWKKWAVGSGFLIPRTDLPFFGVFPDVPKNTQNTQRLKTIDKQVLSIINSVLETRSLPQWQSLSYWFQQCDSQLLTTWPEADHLGARDYGRYLGVDVSMRGAQPHWESPLKGQDEKQRAHKPKVFVYVNRFEGLQRLLEALSQSADVIVYCKNVSPNMMKNLRGAVAFSEQPLDMTLLLKSADYFITNGNHGTSAQALRVGLPQMIIPLQREQMLMAMRVKQAGKGVIIRPNLEDYSGAIRKLYLLQPASNSKPRVEPLESPSARMAIAQEYQLLGM
tara:strand:- start:882 stop:2126 length:1245 start_codon:yes stop_codon:yes gene_type:complete